MRNTAPLLACSAFVIFGFSLAAQDRPNLSGTWQFDSSKSELHGARVDADTWVILEDDSNIQITESEQGATKKIQLKCTMDGKECKMTGGGKASASFWYNGPMLVEMETKGDHVTRYRMKLSEDGKTLTVDTTSIVPQAAQGDVLVFRKQA